MSFRLGLTGGIGMGKTATAAIFAELGHPVWDADAAVHRLYAPGGFAVGLVGAAFPTALVQGPGGPHVDRANLKQALLDDPERLAVLEGIVHPLVAADRAAFVEAHRAAPIVVLDIPLLYETGAEAAMDGTAVVSAPAAVQRARVLARPGLTAEALDMILSRQMPDADKRARATWIIPTDTPESARQAVEAICAEILEGRRHE